VATDLTEHAEAALVRAGEVARALGAPLVVIHVIPDVLRHHPLAPTRGENDAVLSIELEKKAAELVTEQVSRTLRVAADDYVVRIAIGDAEDEIVRVGEEARARLITVGARPRHGAERMLGHVAERVVRYAHTSVMVARAGKQTRRAVVATVLTEGSLPALRFARFLVEKTGVDATLVHVMQLPRTTPLAPALSALGSPWVPPSREAVEGLEQLGLTMLASLTEEYGFAGFEQLEGDPAEVLVARARALDADLLVMGSHGRTGLERLVLGSVAEKVIRTSALSVVVVRAV
jgi:nucleotide-binding universal stress UspA family protein